jgi:putative oxidoreductase
MPVTVVTLVGRTLLALLFTLAGATKIAGPQPFLDNMAAHHIAGALMVIAAGASQIRGAVPMG